MASDRADSRFEPEMMSENVDPIELDAGDRDSRNTNPLAISQPL
jgi:hypothetical protein